MEASMKKNVMSVILSYCHGSSLSGNWIFFFAKGTPTIHETWPSCVPEELRKGMNAI
jgi:hypothetical protein